MSSTTCITTCHPSSGICPCGLGHGVFPTHTRLVTCLMTEAHRMQRCVRIFLLHAHPRIARLPEVNFSTGRYPEHDAAASKTAERSRPQRRRACRLACCRASRAHFMAKCAVPRLPDSSTSSQLLTVTPSLTSSPAGFFTCIAERSGWKIFPDDELFEAADAARKRHRSPNAQRPGALDTGHSLRCVST